jgi:hypothetical protein
MTSSVASFHAMLVPTLWRRECGGMALVMPAAPTYFWTMVCTERVCSSLPLSHLGEPPIEIATL